MFEEIINIDEQEFKLETEQPLPVAVINIPDPDNITTGYTALNIYNIIERNANEIYFINQGQ